MTEKTVSQKPIDLQASQFIVEDLNNIPAFVDIHGKTIPVAKNISNGEPFIVLHTLKDQRKVFAGDWIVKTPGEELLIYSEEAFNELFS